MEHYQKNDRETHVKTFQELPLEMAVHIFSYLKLEEIANLNNQCTLFRNAIAIVTRHSLFNLRTLIDKKVGYMWKLYFVSLKTRKEKQYDLLSRVLVLTFLQTEICQLYIMIWRYVNNLHAWSYLARLVAPILEEVQLEIRTVFDFNFVIDSDILSAHPLLNNFILIFDEVIEARIDEDRKNNFYLKLIDLFTTCPIANFHLAYNTVDEKVVNVQMNFQLRNVQYPLQTPRINKQYNNEKNERLLMKYLRAYIRFSYIMHINKSLNVLKTFTEHKVKLLLNETKKSNSRVVEIRPTHMNIVDLGNNRRQYIFTKNIIHDLYVTGVNCNVTVKCEADSCPLTFDELRKGAVLSSDYLPLKVRRSRCISNRLDLSVLRDLRRETEKVRETKWVYLPFLNEYRCYELWHNFKDHNSIKRTGKLVLDDDMPGKRRRIEIDLID